MNDIDRVCKNCGYKENEHFKQKIAGSCFNTVCPGTESNYAHLVKHFESIDYEKVPVGFLANVKVLIDELRYDNSKEGLSTKANIAFHSISAMLKGMDKEKKDGV